MTYQSKTDEMFKVCNDAWTAGSAAIIGYLPELQFQGITYNTVPAKEKFWGRISRQNVGEEQATLSNCEGLPGQFMWELYGHLFIQIFCPRNQAQGYQKGIMLAELVKNAYRGKTTISKIIFRNARIKEMPPEEHFERFNVVVEYEYNELG